MSNSITITGRVTAIFPTKQVSEKFSKREFVLEIADGKYPQVCLFQLTGDRCAQLDGVKVGDEVRVEYSLRGREWKSPQGELKYFNSLDVWLVELTKGASKDRDSGGQSNMPQTGYGGAASGGIDDDIPFGSADMDHEPSPISRLLR